MVDLIPRSVLFGNPERTSPQLSPDGGALAWIAPRDGVLNLWVAPDQRPSPAWTGRRPGRVTEDTDRGIRAFTWRGTAALCCTCMTSAVTRTAAVRRRPGVARAAGPHAVSRGSTRRSSGPRSGGPMRCSSASTRTTPQLQRRVPAAPGLGRAGQGDREPGVRRVARRRGPRGPVRDRPLPDGSFNVLVRDSGTDDFRYLLSIPAEDATSTDRGLVQRATGSRC